VFRTVVDFEDGDGKSYEGTSSYTPGTPPNNAPLSYEAAESSFARTFQALT
jgi:hypothetical protein